MTGYASAGYSYVAVEDAGGACGTCRPGWSASVRWGGSWRLTTLPA